MKIDNHTYRSAVVALLFVIAGNLNSIEFLMSGDIQPIFFAVIVYGMALVVAVNWIRDVITKPEMFEGTSG